MNVIPNIENNSSIDTKRWGEFYSKTSDENNMERFCKSSKEMKKIIRYTCLFFFISMLVGSFTYFSYAVTGEQKIKDNNRKINNAQHQLDKNKKDQANVTKEMQGVKNKINKTEKEIKTLTKDVVDAHDKLVEASDKLQAEKEKLNKGNENLGKRLRNIYKSGGVGFLDVILSSSSASDLFSNLEMVKYIFKNDNQVVAQLTKTYEAIKEEQKAVEQQEVALKKKQDELAEKEKSLGKDYARLDDKKDDLQADGKKLQKQISQWKADSADIEATIKRNSNHHIGKQGGGHSGGSNSGGASAKGFIRPVNGVITSGFGYRTYQIGNKTYSDFHLGIDIAAPTGTPVKAAKAGRVIWSGWKGSYGNLVVIDHGNGVATAYGHNSQLNVSVGQEVSQGQIIAKVGSTGNSSGPHCHFEVRINGRVVNPLSYV